MTETPGVGTPTPTATDTQNNTSDANTPDAAAWQAAVDGALGAGMVVLGGMMMRMASDTKRQIDEQQAES